MLKINNRFNSATETKNNSENYFTEILNENWNANENNKKSDNQKTKEKKDEDGDDNKITKPKKDVKIDYNLLLSYFIISSICSFFLYLIFAYFYSSSNVSSSKEDL